MTSTTTSAPGADQFSSPIGVSTSPANASLTVRKPAEPENVPAISKAQAGGHRVSRRTAMNSLVALPIAAAVPVASPSITTDEGELAALLTQFRELQSQFLAADAEYNRCLEIYRSIAPDRPAAMKWSVSDPLGHLVEHRSGYRRYWIDSEIDKLRNANFAWWEFVGTQEQWERDLGLAGQMPWDSMRPVVGYEHLFVRRIDEVKQNRARELVAALDEYKAADAAAEIASGSLEKGRVCDKISEKIDGVLEKMIEKTPSTLEDYRAMASAIVNHCWDGEVDIGDDSVGDRLVCAMISSLIGADRSSANG